MAVLANVDDWQYERYNSAVL